MRDVLAKMRECGKGVKMRDFPHVCGMVDTYVNNTSKGQIRSANVDVYTPPQPRLSNATATAESQEASSSSSLYSWRSTDGALSAGASIISWRGGDSIIKSASGV